MTKYFIVGKVLRKCKVWILGCGLVSIMIEKWFLFISESRGVLYSICRQDESFTNLPLTHMLIDGLPCAASVLSADDTATTRTDENSCP